MGKLNFFRDDMNKNANEFRLFLCFIWAFIGVLTVRAIIKDLHRIQDSLDIPNPILKKLGP